MVAPANYRIQPSDILFVQIFQHQDLDKEARVEADGTISLHLIGRVNVEGLTVSEAREKVTELYNRDYLVNPQIDLQVVQFNLDKIQVLGQVRQPGVIGIPPDEELTLLRAISQAGGFTRLARKGSVQIRRELEDGDTKVFVVNASDLISDPDSEGFILQDGDIVFIEERII
jgi:polysaccharide export outer membrane protein